MNFKMTFVVPCLAGMVAALIWDRIVREMVLLTVVILFMCVGILSPKEMLEGFSNKGMITVGLFFRISARGVRKSGALGQFVKASSAAHYCLPCPSLLVRMLPSIAFHQLSLIIRLSWSSSHRSSNIGRGQLENCRLREFLIPLSYM